MRSSLKTPGSGFNIHLKSINIEENDFVGKTVRIKYVPKTDANRLREQKNSAKESS